MADLYTKKYGNTGGSIKISVRHGKALAKRLAKLEDGGAKAIKRTTSDFVSRAPGWVSKGIRQHYGVDTVSIKDAAQKPRRGKYSIKVAGVAIDGATLQYSGRRLTPTHFNMTPRIRPTALGKTYNRIPGLNTPFAMVRPPKKYTIKATIIKGQRSAMPSDAFLGKGRNGVSLPFQRDGAQRQPVSVLHTLSVPQMIDGRAHETINKQISDGLGKRFEHHIQQAMK